MVVAVQREVWGVGREGGTALCFAVWCYAVVCCGDVVCGSACAESTAEAGQRPVPGEEAALPLYSRGNPPPGMSPPRPAALGDDPTASCSELGDA